MRKLLSANFFRLIKSKLFWLLMVALCLYSVFSYYMASVAIENNGNGTLNWNLYFFNEMMVIGAALALFSGFFIGTEYSDGTLRNKLIIGHSRQNVYFSYLIVCVVVGILFFVAYSVSAVIFGSATIGVEVITGLNEPVWCIVCSILIILVYASIFSCIAILDNNKSRTVAATLILAIALVLCGSTIYSSLSEPETTTQAIVSETGEIQTGNTVTNSRYVGGVKRVVYECFDNILPSAQTMHLTDSDGQFTATMPISSVCISFLIVGCGIFVFKKKDLK